MSYQVRATAALLLLSVGCDPDVSVSTGDTGWGGTAGTCEVPVPDHVDLSDPVWGVSGVHFYVPEPGWALSVLLASRQLDGLSAEGLDLALSPSWFLATAVKESFMGCSDDTGADPVHSSDRYSRARSSDADGCFQLEDTTAWVEICRMYPGLVDCDAVDHADLIGSSNQSSTGRDNFETSALAVAWYQTFAYAMLTSHGTSSPDSWFASAADPMAMEKVMSLAYNQGAWSSELTSALGCSSSSVESCISSTWAEDYVTAVASYTADLEAGVDDGRCYDASLTLSDALDWVDSYRLLLSTSERSAIRAAVQDAWVATTGSTSASGHFQDIALPVVTAFEDNLDAELSCPNAQLRSWYGRSCPR